VSTVMWDNDGVCSLFIPAFYPWLCAVEGWTQGEWKTWHGYRAHGMSDEAFVKRLNEYAEIGGFATQEPVSGLREALKQIKGAGHTQHMVTDRPAIAEADTAWWLATNAPEIDSLTVGRDKTVFKNYGPPEYYAIDDRVENVAAMQEAGINAYLLTWPWNEDADLPRVSDVSEFAAIVCGQ
jgi:hypothetical protein